jgi:hypothetical protein
MEKNKLIEFRLSALERRLEQIEKVHSDLLHFFIHKDIVNPNPTNVDKPVGKEQRKINRNVDKEKEIKPVNSEFEFARRTTIL